MMSTTTNDLHEDLYFIDSYNSSLLSPFDYCEFDNSILQWNTTSDQPLIGATNVEPIGTSTINNGSNKKTKKGPSKGDRHSKIPTANGLKDRRMRLSLDVAKQFFQLQDMLCYDKPSKTVKWLLSQAKLAIDELKKGEKSPASSVSEGEVVESAVNENEIVDVVPKDQKKRRTESRPVGKERKKLREEAKERAKERTQKKNYVRSLKENESSCQIQNLKLSSDAVFEIEQQIGATFDVTTNWSSLMNLSHDQEHDSRQMYPIDPELQQFHGASREFYTHPNLDQQLWYY